MTKKEKNKLAKLCGYSEERYTDNVKEGVKRSEYDKDRENAIGRKAIKALIDKVVFGKDISPEDIAEFMQYYDDIESIKTEAKKSIG